MARLRLESRVSLQIVTGLMSVMLHLGLFLLIAFSAGRHDGIDHADTPITRLVMIESPKADRRDGSESGLLRPAVLAATVREPRLDPKSIQPLLRLLPEPDDAFDRDEGATPPVEIPTPSDLALTSAVDPLPTFVMPQAEASALLRRIERVARKKLATKPSAQVTWKQDGKQYNAELVLERATNGIELDHVIADVSAEDRGRRLKTKIMLRQLSYSQFTQIIDYWDPMVQLHDDEIVGRMHINSRFNVLDDARARPTLLGKVSTAAPSFNMQSDGRRRESDVFREGIETGAKRITLSEQLDRLEWTPHNANARVHEFANDTRIRFRADGSYYWWRDGKSDTPQYRNGPAGQPVYFIAARGVTLYVQGVVAGKVLVYSPQKIVVEGSLVYAHDPRVVPDSGDYLGLVCDGDVELAAPLVTGPGDVDIHAALFARRRFVVKDYDYPSSATLRIYGSLAAGSMTASEPRYATRIEFDERFEQLRPPGFPSMNRFALEDWDRRWTEVPEQATADAF
jgi:hypothetical protein